MASGVSGAEPEAEAVPRSEAADLAVEAVPERKRVLCGVKTSMRVLLRIRTPRLPEGEAPERPPVRMACVLDRSGSMAGERLHFAKRACVKLVKHLEPEDTLHFVTYDDAVQVLFEAGDLSEGGKEHLRAQIQAVRTGGTTNLCAGLEVAADLLSGGRSPGAEQPAEEQSVESGLRRIFLFSDGRVNSGVTDPTEIRRRVAALAEAGITTSTFGIGTDFDEPLMRGIAEAGKGRYTFLSAAKEIPRLVSKSVHELLKVYGSETTLDFRGGRFSTVARVYGGEDDTDSLGSLDAGLLQLGDLHNANERLVLAELDVAPPGDTQEALTFPAASWMLTFQRSGAPVQFSGTVELTATHERGGLGSEAASVSAAFSVRRAADVDLEVAERLARGDVLGARLAMSQQLSLLREALETARRQSGAAAADIEALERVLRREQRVAEQIDEGEDVELVRRQCLQENHLNRAMSVGAWSDGRDSSSGGHGASDIGSDAASELSDLSSDAASDAGSDAGGRQAARGRAVGRDDEAGGFQTRGRHAAPGSPRPSRRAAVGAEEEAAQERVSAEETRHRCIIA